MLQRQKINTRCILCFFLTLAFTYYYNDNYYYFSNKTNEKLDCVFPEIFFIRD